MYPLQAFGVGDGGTNGPWWVDGESCWRSEGTVMGHGSRCGRAVGHEDWVVNLGNGTWSYWSEAVGEKMGTFDVNLLGIAFLSGSSG